MNVHDTRRADLGPGAAPPEGATRLGAEPPFVSVIIPVYNNAEGLEVGLDALSRQTYASDRFEVIVVDNGSSEPIDSIVARHPGIRLIQEHDPGSYAARNAGLEVASGSILAFTDSDCVPDPRWIEEGVAALLGLEDGGLVAGAVRFTFRSGAKPSVCELYDAVFDLDQQRFIERGRFGVTANLFTKASVIERVGRFDARMKSVGDRDWGNRVAAAGYELAFTDRAIVAHPARATVRDLLRKRLRVAGGHHDRARKRGMTSLRFAYALVRLLIGNPFSGAGRIHLKASEASVADKVRTWGLYTFLSYAQAAERVRLQLWGKPRRA